MKKIFAVSTMLVTAIVLTGCSLFKNASNYANSFNEKAFEYKQATGTIVSEKVGDKLVVSFVDSEGGAKVALDDSETVGSFGIALRPFDDMRFDGKDLTAPGDYSRFEDVAGVLNYKDIETSTDNPAHTTYFYSTRVVNIADARALKVTSINEELKEEYPEGFKGYENLSVGDYLAIFIDTAAVGVKGDEIIPFTTEAIDGEMFAANVVPETSEETSEPATIVTQVSFAAADSLETKYLLKTDQGSNPAYRYFDVVEAETVVIAKGDATALKLEGEVLSYVIGEGETAVSHTIGQSGLRLERITAINPVLLGYLTGVDALLAVGDYAGVHLSKVASGV